MQTLAEQLPSIRAARDNGQTIGFVSGNFNVVHPGHLRLLKFAAEQTDILVVAVTPDTANGVSVPSSMRLEALRSMVFVQYAFVMQEPLEHVLRAIRPDIVVKGKEHERRDNSEAKVLDDFGGKLLFSSGDVAFSSFALLHHEYFETNLTSIAKPLDFPARRKFLIADLKNILPLFSNLRVLVIGDLIVDTYIDCEPLGMSQEDPTIVVSPIERLTFVGGAGIVAGHARSLGAQVCYVTVCGEDEAASFSAAQLAKFDVDAILFPDQTRPTTNKERFRARGKSLLRVNHLRQRSVDADLARKLVEAVETRLPETDLILFSDFNYGCLPQNVVDAISEKARARGIMMAADSQASSQMADIVRFKGMSLITPTEREARLALKDAESGLTVVAERLKEAAEAKHVVVTLGSEGLLMYVDADAELVADRLPAFNTSPKDVAGAGDCLFACTAMSLCVGADVWRSVYLGSLAAACQVSRVGNLPLTAAELFANIEYGTN